VVVLTTGVGQGELNFDNMVRADTNSSSEEDANLAFQIFEGEEMDAKMANFIGIHMLSDLIEPGNDCFDKFIEYEEDDSDYFNEGRNGQEDASVPDGPY
jgi:hypothetical protein